jgi:hypothetical protein
LLYLESAVRKNRKNRMSQSAALKIVISLSTLYGAFEIAIAIRQKKRDISQRLKTACLLLNPARISRCER